MVIFVGLLLLGWKLLRRRQKEDSTEGRAEMTGIGKLAEMASPNQVWHPEELPTEFGEGGGMQDYVDRG